jgi:chromosomal replication initiator protein
MSVGLHEQLRSLVSAECYQTWFKDLALLDISGGTMQVRAPNRFVRSWLESHYQKELLRAGAALSNDVQAIQFSTAPTPVAQATRVAELVAKSALPPNRATVDGLHVASHLADVSTPSDIMRQLPLSPKYRLENFVVGKSNRVPYVAAHSVAESPGKVYNPLYIHGAHGLGKTHLLHGIAHLWMEQRPPLRMICISCEEFTNAYLRALQARRLDAFRARLRNCDALLMDDAQFLGGREKTQEEFLYTFDTLKHAGKQIVICANVAPRDIKRLDPKLAARFQSELVARLDPPEPALRIELLRAKAKARGVTLSQDAAEVFAAHVADNVCELEGVVCKMLALASAMRHAGAGLPDGVSADGDLVAPAAASDRELAIRALRELGYLRAGPPTLSDVLEAVSRHYTISADDLRSGKRFAGIAHARHVGMFLSKLVTPHGVAEIGRFYGNRNHATVLHACRKVGELAKRDEHVQAEVEALRQVLGG